MVPERGLEPPTNCLRSNCSTNWAIPADHSKAILMILPQYPSEISDKYCQTKNQPSCAWTVFKMLSNCPAHQTPLLGQHVHCCLQEYVALTLYLIFITGRAHKPRARGPILAHEDYPLREAQDGFWTFYIVTGLLWVQPKVTCRSHLSSLFYLYVFLTAFLTASSFRCFFVYLFLWPWRSFLIKDLKQTNTIYSAAITMS